MGKHPRDPEARKRINGEGETHAALVEYTPGTTFPGRLGRTIGESTPAWPAPERAKKDAPNVLFIVLDDTGFGHLGCFGSPIHTPNIDKLAANGLRYTNFHTTALCSPTRACILTGRNHHSNGMACITEGSTGYPGGNGLMPFENGMLSEILGQHGYNRYCTGKWHLTPSEQVSAAGPYDRWPLGRGFERYYGFLGGDTHQYYPDLIADNHQVDAPRTPEQGYHLTEDLVDRTIAFISDSKQVAPDKPFFAYFAPGAMHAPHHAPREYIDQYAGKFDTGWEQYRKDTHARQLQMGIIPKGTVLSGQDPDVPRWESCSADERKLYARMMEVFAGFLEHTDAQLGRLLDHLKALGELDDTLIMLVSDNGASAEGGPSGSVNETKFFNNVPESLEDNLTALGELGGPKHFNHYAWGWAHAGNTPFRRWKRETYRGGVADPLIVHWPSGIRARGEIRKQYTHAIDLVPTVLEALELSAPTHIRGVAQSPIEGVSFAHSFDEASAESRHRTQYFEMFGHRAIYHDGHRAVCPLPGPSFVEAGLGFGEMTLTEEKLRQLDASGWELYHVDEDFAETKDLAQTRRDKLIEMIALWYNEAGKYKVLPLDSRGTARFVDQRPQLTRARKRFVYAPNTASIPESVGPAVLNRSHSITVSARLDERAEGVLFCAGSSSGGFSLYIKGNKLCYAYNYLAAREMHVETQGPLPEGDVTLRFEFEPTGMPDLARGRGAPGRAQLYVDGVLAAQTDLPVTVPLTFGLSGGYCCGRNPGSAITPRYQAPFQFTGVLHEVVVEVDGKMITDTLEETKAFARAAMARQ